MITGRDANKERSIGREIVEKEGNAVYKVIYKLLEVIVKILLGIRQNQVKLLRHFNIPLEDPRVTEDKDFDTSSTADTTSKPDKNVDTPEVKE